MVCENMRVPELKSLAKDHGLRNYSRIRKAELVALFQNNGSPLSRIENPRPPTQTWDPPPPPNKKWIYLNNKKWVSLGHESRTNLIRGMIG